MRHVEAIEAGRGGWQFHQVFSRQLKGALVRMIGDAFGVGVACQVAFDMATEDMRDRTVRQRMNYASGASDRCCILEGSRPGIRRSPEKRSAVFSSWKRCSRIHGPALVPRQLSDRPGPNGQCPSAMIEPRARTDAKSGGTTFNLAARQVGVASIMMAVFMGVHVGKGRRTPSLDGRRGGPFARAASLWMRQRRCRIRSAFRDPMSR